MKKILIFMILVLSLVGCEKKYEFLYAPEKEKIQLVIANEKGDEKAFKKLDDIHNELMLIVESKENLEEIKKAEEELYIWEEIALLSRVREDAKKGDEESAKILEELKNSKLKENKFYQELNKELDKLEK